MADNRDNKGRFIQGASGNSSGRPRGIPNEGKIKIADFVRDATPLAMEHFMRRLEEGDSDAVYFVMNRVWPSHWKAYERFSAEKVESSERGSVVAMKLRALSERQIDGIMREKINRDSLLSLSVEEILLHGKHLDKLTDKEFEDFVKIEIQENVISD